MKIKIEKKYLQIGFTIFFTAIAILMVVFFIWNNNSIKTSVRKFNSILSPVYYGLIIAYLLTPIVDFFEKKLFIPLFAKLKWFEEEKDKNRRIHIRVFSVTLTFVITLFLLYIFFASVIPELIKSIQSIVKQYPYYTRNMMNTINKGLENNPELRELLQDIVYSYSNETDNWLNDNFLPMIQKMLPNVGDMLLGFSSSILKFLKFLWNIIIGLIISIYVLNSKEKFAMSCVRNAYAIFETKTANRLVESVRFTHRTFIGFLSGKVLDSLIIGIITFVVLSIMKMPYTVLISIIVGITNIIPFFGPWFGAIPSLFILVMINPKYALYFLIFIVILQQFDGNFLGPKILSQTTGITTFWIICSITVFSGFFGVPGMLIAVPVTAVLFALFNRITDNMLIKKNLPTDPASYDCVGSISETGEITKYVYVKEKHVSKKRVDKPSLFKTLFFKIKEVLSKRSKKGTD